MMKAFFAALAFLTRIPAPRWEYSRKDWEKSVLFYAPVGLLLGILLWGAAGLVQSFFPATVSAILVLAFWVYLTGGLHLDGWMDLADGLGSNQPKERMLEIMKDSRTGAVGVMAAIILLLLKGAAIYELFVLQEYDLLVLPPVLARFGLMGIIWHYPYLSERGMGSGLKNELTPLRILCHFPWVIALFFFLSGWPGIAAMGLSLFAGWLLAQKIMGRLGGLTGDCYGALVEWMEVAVLLFLFLTRSGWG